MYNIAHSALVPFSAAKMYRLVVDVVRYPDFLKWCSSAAVSPEPDGRVAVEITIDFKGLKRSFTTRNRMRPNREITMSLLRGPFSHLEGVWTFTPLEDDASKVALEMNFAFDNALVEKVVGPLFSHISNQQVDAFCRRAGQLYRADQP